MKRKILEIVVIAVIFLVVWNKMNDTVTAPNEGRAITYSSYINVDGNVVFMDKFKGGYVWADYAAEWCSYCAPQTQTIKSLDRKIGDKILFITVVTGTHEVMQPPTAESARNWATRFNLDPEKVVAKFSTDTLPYHILYSPAGDVLYQGSGLYNESKITAIIKSHTSVL